LTSIFFSGRVIDMKQRHPSLVDALVAAGGIAELARQLGVTRQAVSLWDKIPLKHLRAVSKMTGIPRQQLRPDLYD
jgi:DNA-binding transcriptional regulator YdaS (Cro superfamily)